MDLVCSFCSDSIVVSFVWSLWKTLEEDSELIIVADFDVSRTALRRGGDWKLLLVMR